MMQAYRGSLYSRLLLLSFATLGALWAMAAGVYRLSLGQPPKPEVARFVRDYVEYVVTDLGTPPNRAKAEHMATETGWKIRWEPVKGVGWATSEDLPPSDQLSHELRPNGDWGWRHGSFFVVRHGPQGALTLWAQPWTPPPPINKGWLLLIAFGAACILSLSFVSARHFLMPLRQLDTALASFAEGDLTARLPETRRHDELGRLTQRFNQMATEVGRMFNSRRQLLLDVSHELRTPLTRLNLGLEMMNDHAARASLKEDVAEMEAMLSELLEGARLEQAARLQPQGVELRALVRAVAAEMEGRSPGLRLTLPLQPLTVVGDERGLQVLLRNLLDNAMKYSNQQKQSVELRLWQDEAWVRLTVRDHGPGIPEESLPHLFEPFYRADASRNRSQGGFGLGLHLVQRVVNAHGGEISAGNAPDGGAIFTAKLPLAKPA
jgi:signal transduction histidine kinase